MKIVRLNISDVKYTKEVVYKWLASHPQFSSFGLYGKTNLFEELVENRLDIKQRFVAIADDTGIDNTVSLNELVALHPDIIIITSLFNQEKMYEKLKTYRYQGTVLLLYLEDRDLKTLITLQYKRHSDWETSFDSLTMSLSSENFSSRRFGTLNNLLLIHPPFDVANNRHKKTMPMGLLYLAASVRRYLPKINVKLIDAHIEDLSWDEFRQKIDKEDFDLVGISYMSAQSRNAYIISHYIKQNRPNVLILHGGVHATLNPQEAIKHCDAIIPYEGEKSFVKFVKNFNGGKPIDEIGGIWTKETMRMENYDFEENLDEIPFPDWDILPDVKLYNHPMHVVGGRRFPIIGSRGCPFNCTFCSSPLFWKRKVRWRSPQNVVDEMDLIYKKYGVDRFHFWDDNMVLNVNYARGLAEEIIKRKRNYLWCGLSRASDIVKQKEVLPLLKQAGCVGIEIGVEAFADQVSEKLEKGETILNMEQAVEALNKAGIVPLYTHMLFTPGETISSYTKKQAFLDKLNKICGTSFRSDTELGQLTTPHIATTFAKDAPQMGVVLWQNASDSFHHRVNFIPFSLLNDIPVKVDASLPLPEPLEILTMMVKAIYIFTEKDMRTFLKVVKHLWQNIDGEQTVASLAEKIDKKFNLSKENALAFTSLIIASLGKKGLIASKN